jgi:alpha-tubulin suppressor-like RCC1 family protein
MRLRFTNLLLSALTIFLPAGAIYSQNGYTVLASAKKTTGHPLHMNNEWRRYDNPKQAHAAAVTQPAGLSSYAAGTTVHLPGISPTGTAASAPVSPASCLIPRDASWTQTANCDDCFTLVQLGFDFNFNGTVYDQVYINNNGNLSFGAGNAAFQNLAFPLSPSNSALPPMIAPFWGDVDGRGTPHASCATSPVVGTQTGHVFYKLEATRLTVLWENVMAYPFDVTSATPNCPKLNTFEVVISTLNDAVVGPGKNVLFAYGSMAWHQSTITVGGRVGFDMTTAASFPYKSMVPGGNPKYQTMGFYTTNIEVASPFPDNVRSLSNTCNSFNVSWQKPDISYINPPVLIPGIAITPIQVTNNGGAIPALPFGQTTTLPTPYESFLNPNGIAIHPDGLLVADLINRIRLVTPAGAVSNYAGTGAIGSLNSSRLFSTFNWPTDVAYQVSTGSVFIADQTNQSIRKIDPAGNVTTYAGGGGPANLGFVNGTGTAARFRFPIALAIDKLGAIYVADRGNHAIRKITAGVVSTFAGTGVAGSANHATGTLATFNSPTDLAVDNSGNVYVVDAGNNKIRKITASGAVSTLDSGLNTPSGITIDDAQNIYVSEQGIPKIRIYMGGLAPAIIVAGGQTSGTADGIGLLASFNNPRGMDLDNSTKILYVADGQANTIRKVVTSGYTLSSALPAGLKLDPVTGTISGTPTGIGKISDTVQIFGINTVGYDTATVIIHVKPAPPVIDYGIPPPISGAANITPIVPTNTGGPVPAGRLGQTVTLAGTGTAGSGNGTGSFVSFNKPKSVAVDAAGNVYVADSANNKIRVILADGFVYTFAGSGTAGAADNIIGTNASFRGPSGLAFDNAGNLYVADAGNHKIRKISAAGAVTTLAGTGTAGSADHATGSLAGFNRPTGLTVDDAGNVWVADAGNSKIRKITPAGAVSTFAGTSLPGSTDNVTGLAAGFRNPAGVAIDEAGNVFVGDRNNHKIRKITPDGSMVITFAGTGIAGSKDTTAALSASFNLPTGLAFDNTGNLWVADEGNHKIRKITAAGVVTTLAGTGFPGSKDTAAGSFASFQFPAGVAMNDSGKLYVADANNHKIRTVTTTGYTISPAISAGLLFDSATGVISGKPSIIAPKTYKVTAYNIGGSGTDSVSLSFVPGDAKLSSLISTGGAFTFIPNTFIYNVSVASTIATVRLTPTVASPGATVTVNGIAVTSGTMSAPITLTYPSIMGSTTFIPIVVTAPDGITTSTYMYNVMMILSNDATLASLVVAGGTLTPVFAPGTLTYTVTVPNGTASTIVSASTTFNKAYVQVNGQAFYAATVTALVNLNFGNNIIPVRGLSESTNQSLTYSLNIIRALSNNTNLGALSVSNASLSPVFSPATAGYTDTVPFAVATVAVAFTTTDNYQSVTVNGVSVTGGLSGNITLQTGINTIIVRVTAQDGTQKDHTLMITRTAPPTATVSGTATVCQGMPGSVVPVRFAAGGGTAPYTFTYKINGGANLTVVSVGDNAIVYAPTTTAGSYVYSLVSVTDALLAGQAQSGAATITVNALPVAAITGNNAFCPGSFTTLTAGAASTYNWSNGATTQSTTINSAGSYTVTVTNSNGCTAVSAPFAVVLNPVPAVPVVQPASATTFCAGGSVVLNIANTSGAVTYQWKKGAAIINGATGSSYTATTTGNYTVVATNASGCSETATAVDVIVTTFPSAPVITAPSSASVCSPGSVTLTATGAANYVWSGTNTSNTNTATTNYNSGTYTITVSTTVNGCTAVSAPLIFTVQALPTVAAISGVLSVCTGSVTELTNATPGGVWSSDNTGVATINSYGIVSGIAAGTATISYAVTNANNCVTIVTALVMVNALPVIATSGNSPVCTGTTIHLSAASAQFVMVASGVSHSLAIKPDGTLWTWGSNSAGQLGNGTTTNSNIPVQVGTENTWVSVQAGQMFSLGLKSDGSVWAWGFNTSGQLGDGTFVNKSSPVPVSGLSGGATAIASGSGHSLALVNGVVKSWGSNNSGQLGDGTFVDKNIPVPVSGLFGGVTDIAAGGSQSLIIVNGAAKSWGQNNAGQLGNGTNINSNIPVQVSGLLSGVTSIAGGNTHSLAIVNGSAKSWGNNGFGQLGDGTFVNKSIPVQVSGLSSGVTAVTGGLNHSLAIVKGSVMSWGFNPVGQLGDGSTTNRNTPVSIINGATSIAAGNAHSLAIANGVAMSWGQNSAGQLGDGTNAARTSPVTVLFPAAPVVTGYTWTGPNGFSSTQQNPSINNVTVAATGNYIVTATDANGCSAPAAIPVTVNPLPTATVSGTTTVCKDAAAPAILFTGADATAPYTFIYTVNGGAQQSITSTGNTATLHVPTGNTGTFTYTLVSVKEAASTLCANTAAGSATVTVNTLPTFTTCPSDQIVNATTAQCTAPVTYTATATGIPAPMITYAFSGATTGSGNGTGSGQVFNKGVTTVTLTAANSCGAATCTFTVSVTDDQPPVISCAGNISVNATSAAGAVIHYTIPAGTDNCSGATTVRTAGLASGSIFPIGTTTVTHTVTDGAGLTAECSFTVTIAGLAPVIYSPANITVNNDAGQCGALVNFVATETTAIPASTITYSIQPGSFFPAGTTTVTATATNAVGISISSFTITVLDNTAPLIICPAPVTINCQDAHTPAYTGAATATDNCTPAASIAITHTDVSTYSYDPSQVLHYNYVIIRTWRATDMAGNFSECVQTITVQDIQAPVLSTAPANTTVACNAVPAAAVLTATDNCSIPTVVYNEVRTDGNCPGNYILTRTWTVTDVSGNTSGKTQTITVQDTQVPVLSAAPADVTVECNTVPAAAILTATDNCSTPVVTYNEVRTDGNCSGNYILTRTWTATDACGNTSSKTQLITVQDTQVPVLSYAPVDVTVECNAVPAAAILTATDNCSTPVVTYNEVRTDGNCSGNYILTRTWTATDACGNTSSKTQLITVQDTQVPVLSYAPVDVTVECNAVPAAAVLTATDNCSIPVVTYSESRADGNCSGNYTLTRTWTATDACGNTSSKTQVITVQDTQVPVLSAAPADATVECNAVPAAAVLTAADNCSMPAVTYNEVRTDGNCSGNHILTRTWTATDACGNTSTKIQVITVQDTQVPVLSAAPADVTVECNAVPAAAVLTATDNCSTPVVTYHEMRTDGNCSGNYILTRTWTATDACGNISSKTQVITVQDTQVPVLSAAPADVPVECNAVPIAAILTATDNCSIPTVVYNEVRTDGNCPGNYILTRTWTATDACGNISSKTQVITVQDTQVPVLSDAPAGVTVECNAIPAAAVLTATDNCSTPVVTYNESRTDGNCPGNYILTRTWTATDACGNTSSKTQVITVQDTQAPVLSDAPAGVTVECNAIPAAAVLTATDNCSTPVVTYNESRTDGNCPGNYILTRTWTATDACGNTSSKTQVITVQDTQAPVLSAAPADITVECNAVPAAAILTAMDNCSAPVVTYSESRTDGNCAGNYILTRTWTATDACGNISSKTQMITVQDTQVPVLSAAPADITVECNAVPAAVILTATDNCSIPVVTYHEVRTDGNCSGNYILTRTWTATDACGNISSKTRVITVQDTQVPVLSAAPADITVECNAVPAAVILTAMDNCSAPVVTYSESRTDGNCAGNYILTRTWTATDACGNISSKTQVITVQDTQVPVLSAAPTDLVVECNAVPAAAVLTAIDNCSTPVVTYSESRADGNCSGNYILTRTWTATDACGNTSFKTQVITVQDTQVPVLSAAPADATVECNAVPAAAVLTATDNCSTPVVTYTEVRTDGSCSGNYTLTRTWTATDACGNTSSKTQVITVQDTQVPVLSAAPADATVECNAVPAAAILTATDNCSTPVVTYNEVRTDGNCSGHYTLTRTWTATDACGNTSFKTQVITVQDTQVPVLSAAPADATVECNAVHAAAVLTATDNCSTPVVTYTEVRTDGSCSGNYTLTRTWIATDACGNTSFKTQVITVQDIQAPVLNATPADITVECNVVPAAVVITATDNCSAAPVVYTETRTDGNGPGNYTLTRTWTAIDACGNMTSHTQLITVRDTQVPVTIVAVLPTVAGACSASVTAPTATDNCGGTIVGTTTDPTGYTAQGTYTITWTYDDGNGNSTTQTQTVIVQDITAPVPSVNTLPTVTGQCAATVTAVPAANDACTGPVTATTTDPLTYTVQGTYTVTWTYTDAYGNSSTQTQTVIVNDNIAPVPTVATLPTISGSCSAGITLTPVANACEDDCRCCRNGCHCRPGSCQCRDYDYRFRGIVRMLYYWFNEYFGDDDDDNHGCDNNNTGNGNIQYMAAPTATDNCKGTIVGTTTDPLTYSTPGTHIIHWTFDDGNGNITVQEQQIIVTDNIAPVPTVSNLPTIVGQCSVTIGGNGTDDDDNDDHNWGPCRAFPSIPTAKDNCVGLVYATTTDPLSYNSAGTYTIHWTYNDGHGNITTQTQTVIVKDQSAPKPVVKHLATISGNCSVTVTTIPTAKDNCTGIITATTTDPLTYTVAGSYTIRWKYNDGNGNTTTQTQTIVVVDNTRPVLNEPADITISCSASTLPGTTGMATATDNCGTPVISYTDQRSGNVITRTWKATDASGNHTTDIQKITIGSSFNPVVTSVPTTNTYTGGNANNLYIGYGAQSTSLQVCTLPSSGAPYTYAWSGSATGRLNSTSSSAPVFTPNTHGTFTFLVTVTNKYGCAYTDNITICVTDIRVPGTNGAKVYVCHTPSGRHRTPQTLQVPLSQVASHINNHNCGSDGDDRLGSCDQVPCNSSTVVASAKTNTQTTTAEAGSIQTTTTEEELKVTVMPNPSTSFFTLKLESRNETPVNLRVMDGSGRVVDARTKLGANSSFQIGHNYSSGTYYAELIQGGKRKVVQLIKGRG